MTPAAKSWTLLPPAVQRLADSVSYRLETPRLKVWKDAAGNSRLQSRNSGFVDRRLSPSDREEVTGACVMALAQSGELACVTRCGGLITRHNPNAPKKKQLVTPHFQASILPAFSLARKTLEMGESSHTRKMASFSLDAHLGTDNELSPYDGALIRASIEAGKRQLSRREAKHNPRRTQLAAMFRGLRQLAKRARALDQSRKARASYKSAMGMIRLAVTAANGGSLGEWLELPQTLRDCQLSRFRSYLKPAIADLSRERAGEGKAHPRALLGDLLAHFTPPAIHGGQEFKNASTYFVASRSIPAGQVPAFTSPPSRYHEGKVIASLMRSNRHAPTLHRSAWKPFEGLTMED